MGDFEAATDAADGHVPRNERDVFEVETAVNNEPGALFALHGDVAPSTIAEAVIGHAGAQAAAHDDVSACDDRPTRRQPALELLALHAASSLAGNATAAAVAAPAGAAVAALAADEDLAIPVESAPVATDDVAAREATDDVAANEAAGEPDPTVAMEPVSGESLASASAEAKATVAEAEAEAPAPVAEAPATVAAAESPASESPQAQATVAAMESPASESSGTESAGADPVATAAAPAAAERVEQPQARPAAVSTVINAVPKEIDDAHTEQLSGASATPTTRTPALETDAEHADRIAQQRGLRPITRPEMREAHVRRRWVIASTAVSLVCLAVTASVVVWARGEVRSARTARAAEPRELVASNAAAGTLATAARRAQPAAQSAVAMTGVAAAATQPDVAMTGVAAVKPTCAIRVTSNIDAATVWIDGLPHGTVPAEVPVECGIDSLVELRHPRYASFKRSLSVAEGVLEVEAQLEREKTELTVWSNPPGATVTYNGHALGKTPLVTHVNRYEHGTLWFRAPGRAADWRKIVPKQAKKTVSVALKPRT